MKIRKIHVEKCNITKMYEIEITDNLGRNTAIVFHYNKEDKRCRPMQLIVDGRNYGAKLREFLNQNGLCNTHTEDFMKGLIKKVNEINERRKMKNSSLQVVR